MEFVGRGLQGRKGRPLSGAITLHHFLSPSRRYEA